MKVIIASSFKKNSGIWRYAFELNKRFKANGVDVQWLDLYHNKKHVRAMELLRPPRTQCDVLILTSPLLCKLLDNTSAKFTVVIVHDLYPLTVGAGSSRAVRLITSHTYKKADKASLIAFISEFSRQEFSRVFKNPKKWIILSGGIDHDIFRPVSKKERKKMRDKMGVGLKSLVLCSVGTDEKRKNLTFAIRVMKLLSGMGQDVRMMRVGKISRKTKKLAKQLQLEDKIILFSSVTDKELAEIYSASDFLLFPSLYEGLGLPPAEAMACGCPAIVSNKTSLTEVGIRECILPLDESVWAEKILKIYSNKTLRNKIMRSGLEKSRQFDWDDYFKKLSAVIKDAIMP